MSTWNYFCSPDDGRPEQRGTLEADDLEQAVAISRQFFSKYAPAWVELDCSGIGRAFVLSKEGE